MSRTRKLLTSPVRLITLPIQEEMAHMKTQMIKIGDAQAVCIPPALLGELSLGEEVEINLEDGQLSIRPLHSLPPLQTTRAGWAEAAQRMTAARDDALLDPELTGQSEFDQHEWEWEGLGEG